MLLPVLYIHACALAVSISATHLWLAATPLSLPGAGTIDSDSPLSLIERGYTLLLQLNEQIESETLHGTGSSEDTL